MPDNRLPYAQYYDELMECIHHGLLYCFEMDMLVAEHAKRPLTPQQARKWTSAFFKGIQFSKGLEYKLGIEARKGPMELRIARDKELRVGILGLASADMKEDEAAKAIAHWGPKFDDVLHGRYVVERCSMDVLRALESGTGVSPDSAVLLTIFKRFANPKYDAHLRSGISWSERNKSKGQEIPLKNFARLSGVLVRAYLEAARVKGREGVLIPSPFYVLCNALTIPEESHTTAYAYHLCRSVIQSYFNARCHPGGLAKTPGTSHVLSEDDVLSSVSSFRKYAEIQLRWPDTREKNPQTPAAVTNYVVGHTLACKGIVHLWFQKDPEAIRAFLQIVPGRPIQEHYFPPKYYFRLSPSHRDIPQHGEVINMMFGIPLPFRGGDTVFLSGLKPTTRGGLVISLSGEPGVGKTSTALALAAQLAPLGTKTYYISLEEEEEELDVRLTTLIPDHLRGLSINQPKNKWFRVDRINPNLELEDMQSILDQLKRDYDSAKPPDADHPLSPCPALLVIDNINELLNGSSGADRHKRHGAWEQFVKSCRDFGVLVILISAADVPHAIRLDYLVDVTIVLRQEKTGRPEDKPVRLFQLLKTRHQISRQGSHVMHISGAEGLRLSPQIPSEMDRKQIVRHELFDDKAVINTLNLLEYRVHQGKPGQSRTQKVESLMRNGAASAPYLNLFARSRILVHGYGSSGKAGFALKLLLTPPLDGSIPLEQVVRVANAGLATPRKRTKATSDLKHLLKPYEHVRFRRKVLVISFLNTEQSYYQIVDKLHAESLSQIFPGLRKAELEILAFYPGYLTAEDLVNKVIRKLDAAILEGDPFTGVLFDGLHNVFLQFLNLQEHDMIWPLLYSILARYDLTVVSTFTNFSLNGQLVDDQPGEKKSMVLAALEDQSLMKKGMIPFLHMLVKATDFYLLLEEHVHQTEGNRNYYLAVKSAQKQTLPVKLLEWDRQQLVIKREVDRTELSPKIREPNPENGGR